MSANHTYSGGRFAQKEIEVDGKVFVDCIFLDCELVYSGGAYPSFTRCEIDLCVWRFSGAASRTLHFLASTHRDAGEVGREMVEQICDSITGRTVFPQNPPDVFQITSMTKQEKPAAITLRHGGKTTIKSMKMIDSAPGIVGIDMSQIKDTRIEYISGDVEELIIAEKYDTLEIGDIEVTGNRIRLKQYIEEVERQLPNLDLESESKEEAEQAVGVIKTQLDGEPDVAITAGSLERIKNVLVRVAKGTGGTVRRVGEAAAGRVVANQVIAADLLQKMGELLI